MSRPVQRRWNQRRCTARMEAAALDLADVVVKDTEARDVRLGDLWRDKPAVVVFVRHYG
jgi:hypothetical protein